jgi:hypothetical protein
MLYCTACNAEFKDNYGLNRHFGTLKHKTAENELKTKPTDNNKTTYITDINASNPQLNNHDWEALVLKVDAMELISGKEPLVYIQWKV